MRAHNRENHASTTRLVAFLFATTVLIYLSVIFQFNFAHAEPIDVNDCMALLHNPQSLPLTACRDFITNGNNPAILRAELLAQVADKEYEHKDVDLALHDLDEALKIDHQNVSSLKLKGFIEIENENFHQAEEDLVMALNLDTWDYSKAVILTNLSFIALFQGRPDAAIARANGAIKLDAELSRAYRNKGAAYFQKGKFDKAIEDERRALSLPEPPSDAYFYLGQALSKENKTDAAIDAFGHAIKLGALLKYAYVERAKLLVAKGNGRAALRDLESALHIEPGDKDVISEISRLSNVRR